MDGPCMLLTQQQSDMPRLQGCSRRCDASTCLAFGSCLPPHPNQTPPSLALASLLPPPLVAPSPPHTQVVHSTGVFGCIRSLAAFRLTGAQRDYVIIGSDSGRIIILDYNKDKNVFTKV